MKGGHHLVVGSGGAASPSANVASRCSASASVYCASLTEGTVNRYRFHSS